MDAVKALFKMFSPSKVWAEVGRSISEGVALGIEQSSTFISDAGRTVLDRSFKSWMSFLKIELGKGAGGLKQMLWKFTDQTLNYLVVRSGETAAQAMKRALDQIIAQVATVNAAMAGYLRANQASLFEMLGEQAATVVGFAGGEKFAALMQAAGSFGGLGGTAASMLEQRRLGPQREKIRLLEEQLRLLKEQGASLEEQAKVSAILTAERKDLKNTEADLAALAKQQADLQFIQQQSNLITMIRDQGLNVKEILGGLKLGLGADLQGVIQAMTRAMQEMIKAAEKELGIASESKVFAKMGRQALAGFGLGALQGAPAAAGAVQGALAQTVNNYNYPIHPTVYRNQGSMSVTDEIRMEQMLRAGA